MDQLESRSRAKATAAAGRAAREAAASQRRSERDTEADERARACRDAEEARLSHVTWTSLRGLRAVIQFRTISGFHIGVVGRTSEVGRTSGDVSGLGDGWKQC